MYRTQMASRTRALLVSFISCAVLRGCTSDLGAKAESCDFATVMSLRSEWDAHDEPCEKKLPFELWTLMKAEGSAQNPDAQHVRGDCIQSRDVDLVELITPKGYVISDGVAAAPGDVVGETEHAITYEGATAATFEAFCDDDGITRVVRIDVALEAYRPSSKKYLRRLQATTSQAGQAHQVAELIAGLSDIGCTRTTGEDQTVCVVSNSFDANGAAASLQASGDLPVVEVVKDIPAGTKATDEGSAMTELIYDIARGASYKFNSGFTGMQALADDMGVLANNEACDVIIDDVIYFREPAFRDGVIAEAVDAAADGGTLCFSSAGNDWSGWRFDSNFECTAEFVATFPSGSTACGSTSVASHVFQPNLGAASVYRYLWEFSPTRKKETIYVHWDEDVGTVEDVLIVVYVQDVGTEDLTFYSSADEVSGGNALEFIQFEPRLTSDGEVDESVVYFLQIIHFEAGLDDLAGQFLMASTEGITGKSDGSMRGHACASNCVAVAAMAWTKGGGVDGAFEDPESSSVDNFSSRGPCVVSGEVRNKPTTCAADGVSVSTPGFDNFFGTSASAAVAAAIATIVRAACFPKVVTYTEMMEMLTNYDYTVDVTSDADGAAETWGPEAGYGIISASKMLAWVEANCSEACAAAPAGPPSPAEPVVPSDPPAGQTCSDGTEGIEGSGPVCCPIACNQCGGTGCSQSGAAAGLTSSDCCSGEVQTSGVYCDTNQAPCIIGTSPAAPPVTDPTDPPAAAPAGPPSPAEPVVPSDPPAGVTIACNQCGGTGCSQSGAAAGLTSSDCCSGEVQTSGVYCDTNQAPCIIGTSPAGPPVTDPTDPPAAAPAGPPSPAEPVVPSDPPAGQTCSDGTEGIEGSGPVCCPIACTQCGGTGCSQSGAAAGLTSSDCCTGDIQTSGVYCDTNQAPCIIGSAPGPA
ncbi:unnamed protein product [Pylaiella littoralis]